MLEVIVYVEGGVIHNVEVPPGVRVIIRDADVEGYEGELQGEEGEEYVESVYEGSEE